MACLSACHKMIGKWENLLAASTLLAPMLYKEKTCISALLEKRRRNRHITRDKRLTSTNTKDRIDDT